MRSTRHSPPPNSVVELLHSRRASGSQPGRRADDSHVALAVEGGGMRGIVSGAMLSALADHSFTNSFDSIYSLSAGAINSTYFAAGGGWQALSVYYDDLITREFIDFRRLLQRKPILSLDYVLNDVMRGTNPLDYVQALESKIDLNIIVADINRLEPVVLSKFDSEEELEWALRTSASLPVIAGPPPEKNGTRFLDGGVLMSHPVEAALAGPASHIVVIRTKSSDKRTERVSVGTRLLARRLNQYQPGLGAKYIFQKKEYDRIEDQTRRASDSPSSKLPHILDVHCSPGSHAVGRLTQERGLLYQGMRAGYQAMLLALFGTEYQVHLRPAVREEF